MKQIVKIACLLLSLLCLFVGCTAREEIIATNKLYDIIRRGDQYSIRLKKNDGNNTGYGTTDSGMVVEPPFRYFTDLQSMKRAVLEGDFTRSEIRYAISAEKNSKIDTDEALIFNPYQLYQPYLPDGGTVEEKIQWRVWAYDFTLDFVDRAVSGGCVVLHEADYMERIFAHEAEFAEIKESAQQENPSVQIIEEKADSETGKHSIIYTKTYKTGNTSTFKETRQKYETPEKTLYIAQKWYDYNGDEDAAPYVTTVYGKENGGYFYVYLYCAKEDVNAQWFSQFGITPYEGNEPAPKAIG